ncbi:hypothetical protein DFH29DRAFT_998915 [Suillus ampliporus]|nr:hypothetical protein DFH29DRAFT_998915 [Suillus ampliporus]
MVSDRSSHGSLSSCWTATSPFGDFRAQDGYAGYVPHAPYFTQFYDMLVEESAPAARQLIASLPADIIKQDHSFKAIKCLGKTDGVPTFNALFTTVNQYSEIRSMNFTPSKGQDGWAPVLSAMLPSLVSFGHSPPKIVFTDNIRADKDKLLSIFPSLSADVTPVQLPSAQDLLLFPEDWSYVPLTMTYQVNHQFNIIMNQHTPTTPIVAMFSIKWPINAATGKVGRVGLIQIGYQKVVYLIQAGIKLFLCDSRDCKVGINVTSNLQWLHVDCIPASRLTPFAGQLDVGQMASERNAAHIGNTSMATLCTNVLRKHVTQDPMICISPLWGISELPPSFIQHAALDIYATWSIYHALTAIEAPQKVTFLTPGGTAVTMYAPDGRTIAQGVITPDCLASFGGVNVTKTQVIMVIHKVLVPAYLISGSLLSSRQSSANIHSCSANGLGGCFWISEDQHLMSSMSTLPANSDSSNDVNFPSPFETVPELDEPDSEAIPEQTVGSSSVDETALQAISQLLIDIAISGINFINFLFPFTMDSIDHLHMPSVPQFFLQISMISKQSRTYWHDETSQYHAKLISKPEWILTRVRCYVPPREILFSHVAAVVKTYGPLKDATTGQLLFNDKAWEVTKNILEHIRNGYYSDPPDIPLYFEIGKDKDGLILYRCCRGTNDVENGVHQNLIRRFTLFNVSPRRTVNMIQEYTICHNMQVGTLNRSGLRYIGHFDVPLKNRVASLREHTSHAFRQDFDSHSGGWVNGDNYEEMKEPFGILAFDDDTLRRGGMLPFSSTFVKENKIRYEHLGWMQGTRFAVLPVHSREERALFQAYAESSLLFSGPQQPDFVALASHMNAHADGVHVFYKLPKHMRTHYKAWLDFSNEKSSVTLSMDATNRICALLTSHVGCPPEIPTALPQLLSETVSAPQNPPEPTNNPWQLQQLLADH